MKIAIIGYSGSGKSTLANFLGQHYNCEVLHLDKIHFTSNWQERTVDEMTDDISTFMLQSDWIIEGNYSACLYEERMRETVLSFSTLTELIVSIGHLGAI